MMADIDEAQWIAWYESLERPLYNTVYRWLWDSAECEDVVHEAFLRCWLMRHRIEAAGFKALIYRTALRLASKRVRRRRLWRFVPLAESGIVGQIGGDVAANSATGCDTLMSRHLRRALAALPESLRRVLLLGEVGGLSYKEIADVMRIKEGTVGSRRNRALGLLRKRLAEQGIEWNED